MDDPDDSADAREAFSLLGHEIRLEILLALLEDWMAVYTEPKSYAELMDAVGMRDSGKFNYHLGQLRGVYVRKVEGGYVPTASATALYRAVLAHRPTDRFEDEFAPTAASCPACGSTPSVRYERGFLSVDCDDCSEWVGFTYPFPQNGVESRDPDDLLEAVHARVRHDLGLAREGQCPDCAGTTTVDLRLEAVGDGSHWVSIECDTCTFVVGTNVLSAVLGDDRVASALREAGVDLERYQLDLPTGPTRIESREPPTLAVDVEGEVGTVTVVVDDALDVQSVERE